MRALCFLLLFVTAIAATGSAHAASLSDWLTPARLAQVFPGADRAGPVAGDPPAAPVYRNGETAGYVFSSHAVVDSTGYSGKPLDIAVGLTLDGTVAGAALIEQHEPILIIGVSEQDIKKFVERFRGVDIRTGVRVAGEGREGGTAIDAISGASVSSVVIGDAIVRASRIVARSRGFYEEPSSGSARLDVDRFRKANWDDLTGDGYITQMRLTNADVDTRFPDTPAPGGPREPQGTFIKLYAALATPAMAGRNLFGDQLYSRLMSERRPGEQVLFLAATGLYSFKGTAWVREGVFDRIQIVQGDRTIRLTKTGYRRLDEIPIDGLPDLREMATFLVPASPGLDPTQPWTAELLVTRRANGEARYARFPLRYVPPAEIVRAVPGAAATRIDDPLGSALARKVRQASGSLWLDIWRSRTGSIAILSLALVILTTILFLQDVIARRPRLYGPLRYAFLGFTVVWLGFYAGAQLSVVNVLTFSQALLTGFQWELFLLEPLIFILWSYVAIAMLFWGRGVFCGWLCPFGALQELLNHGARRLGLPQLEIPFGLHERVWPLKYVIFLALFAISLGSMTLAVAAAEVEPFKTVIALKFMRHWPFALYAAALLVAGLFVERFFCRYLCPLGGALAIPARLRMFDWLKRRSECGVTCQRCAVECTVQAIHPNGRINPNECIHCLNCQVLYFDDQRCPPLIEQRKRRERRLNLTSNAMQSNATVTGMDGQE